MWSIVLSGNFTVRPERFEVMSAARAEVPDNAAVIVPAAGSDRLSAAQYPLS
jgi:hypothetical protein